MFNNSVLREVFDNVILDKTFVYPSSNYSDDSSSVMGYLKQYTNDPKCMIEMYKLDYTNLVEYVCSNLKNPACLIVLEKLHENGYDLSESVFTLLNKDNIEAVKLILKYYPDCLLKEHEENRSNPFDCCQSPEGLSLVLDTFKDRINDVDKNDWNQTPLIGQIENAKYRNGSLSKITYRRQCELRAACFKMMLDNGADPNIENKRLLEELEKTPEEYKSLVKPMLGLEHIPKPLIYNEEFDHFMIPDYIVLTPDEVEKNDLNALTDRDVYTMYYDVPVTPDVKYIASVKNDKILKLVKLIDQPEMEFLLCKSKLFGYQVIDMEKVREFIEKGYILTETFKGILVKSTHYKPSKLYNRDAIINIEEYKDVPHKTLAELGILNNEEYNRTHFKHVDTEMIRLSNQIMLVLEKYKDTIYMKERFPNLYGDFTDLLKNNKIDLSNENFKL